MVKRIFIILTWELSLTVLVLQFAQDIIVQSL